MNPKTRICLTLTVSSGCPTITLDAPVTKSVVYVQFVATEDKHSNDRFCMLHSFVGEQSVLAEQSVHLMNKLHCYEHFMVGAQAH